MNGWVEERLITVVLTNWLHLLQVLALSVREALQQTLESLRSGKTTTGMDVGLQGGHSTDGECTT